MRSSKKASLIAFIIIVLGLFGLLSYNFLSQRISQNAARNYVPKVKKVGKAGQSNNYINRNPAKAITLTGPIDSKTIADMKVIPGFYDAHLTGGTTQYFNMDGLTPQLDEQGLLLIGNLTTSLEAGRTIQLTPTKFSPLKKQGDSYVITNPGNYLPDVQIPVGSYHVTYEGKMSVQEPHATDGKPGTNLSLELTKYDGSTVMQSVEKDHFLVGLYKGPSKHDAGMKEGLLRVQKNRLIRVSMTNVIDPNLKILLTPIKK
ncbi:hypothetical protein [Oenococcus kitaharae]|uniref:Uncharacterized protein n=1 Tax=Oenococcus kitaharae DSM 17330 TaxID=1045004 RepID=G9WIX2_9LACO|nr:hypothetical protein [Oenococcus kitaharae]EHN58421.1 hypothetical protein OKIT_0297 [Oenococcus kitaharae DSM 17330]OEY81418.1 hypothetical protein NT95_07860 [Oenococcus kitaharae]OEY82906.1 hypothetical protein NV75_05960 [Oenococcus kitaharae]OEY84550.1 hypothetical protein NT96_04675 [Oenococcus kitaharae]